MKRKFEPHESRYCGARTRSGRPCRNSPIRNRARCKLHGGRSTGPRTAEGRARSSQNRRLHGRYTRKAIQEEQESHELLRRCREFLAELATQREAPK